MTSEQEKAQVEKIRDRYVEKPKEVTSLENLKRLDKKVKAPAITFAYIFGSLGTLILGTGMCFALGVLIKDSMLSMIIGVSVGIVGAVLMIITYPLFKRVLNKRKLKYSKEIVELSDQLLNKQA